MDGLVLRTNLQILGSTHRPQRVAIQLFITGTTRDVTESMVVQKYIHTLTAVETIFTLLVLVSQVIFNI